MRLTRIDILLTLISLAIVGFYSLRILSLASALAADLPHIASELEALGIALLLAWGGFRIVAVSVRMWERRRGDAACHTVEVIDQRIAARRRQKMAAD